MTDGARRRPATRRLGVGSLLTAVLLLAAACGDDAGTEALESTGELRPFAEVQASDFEFEADPGDPSRGIFRVTTTEAMICAIVWGETEQFGRFNNSLAMNGTGIIDHDVFLPGAEPGREYFFRVQGSTANGDQYRSETGTFTIPESSGAPGEPSARADQGVNLALGAVVADVSSEFSDAFAAELAIDDDTTTEWSTSGDGDNGFIELDLGGSFEIEGVEFVTRSMADGSAITEEFTVTVDGGEPLGPFAAGSVADPRTAEVGVTGQVVRFEVATSTGGNVGAVEVRVLAPSDQP